MRKHRHDPVWRVNPVVAAAGADVGVTRKDGAMKHEHVVAEHEHASIRRGRVRYPTRTGAFPGHWVGNIYGRAHLHGGMGLIGRIGRMRRMCRMGLVRFFLQWHELHSALRAIPRMIEDNFGMHQTGIFLRW